MKNIKTIYVNNNNRLEYYVIKFHELSLKKIISDIDFFYGRGERLKEERINNIGISNMLQRNNFGGEVIEVVKKKYAGEMEIVDYFHDFVDIKPYVTDCFNIEYYKFKPHELSKLCRNILEKRLSIKYIMNELSEAVKKIDNQYDEQELKFMKRILNSVSFIKINLNQEVLQKNRLAEIDKAIEDSRTIIETIYKSEVTAEDKQKMIQKRIAETIPYNAVLMKERKFKKRRIA